jgi:RNA polymerase sigma-70 factor (ECF subfamily)
MTGQPDDDAVGDATLAAARGGDERAFATLYRATHPRLVRYAAILVGQDADDVTAEAWLQISRDLRKFEGTELAFRGWAATIVRNRAMDHVRALARRPSTPMELSALDSPARSDTETDAEESFSTAAALALIATLPPDQAEAVLLRVVVGLDAVTAARVLDKRPGAVRVATHRGLRALAARLERESDDANTSTAPPEVTP